MIAFQRIRCFNGMAFIKFEYSCYQIINHRALIKFSKKTVCSIIELESIEQVHQTEINVGYWINGLSIICFWTSLKELLRKQYITSISYFRLDLGTSKIHSIYSVYIYHKYTIYPSTITNYDMLGWMLCLFRIITLSDSVTIDVISNKKLESIFV